MRITRLANLFLLALFFSVPAQAEQIEFKTSWVVSTPITSLNVPLPKVGETARIKRKDFVLGGLLVPHRIAELSTSVQDHNGDEIAPAGAELYALEAKGAAIFCLSGMVFGQASRQPLSGLRHHKPTCFIDSDMNGQFDSNFSARNLYEGLPNFSGRTPRRPKPVTGGDYTTFRAKRMLASYYVALEYRGNQNLSNKHHFRTVFGSAWANEHITSRILIENRDIPSRTSFLGGEFEVVAGGENQLDVKLIRPVANIPFGVSRTLRYGY